MIEKSEPISEIVEERKPSELIAEIIELNKAREEMFNNMIKCYSQMTPKQFVLWQKILKELNK